MQFNLADLPLRLLLAAWLYRRLCKRPVGVVGVDADKISVINLTKYGQSYDVAIRGVFMKNQHGRLADWLAGRLQAYADRQWEDVRMLANIGVHEVALVDFKEEE